MTTPSVALCMIVKNEAERLPGCLAAAAPAVDEIVVVDTGSTDATPDLARRHGARVIAWPWRDDFAAARNESLRHAHAEWALVLDADERLAADAAVHVREAVGGAGAGGFDCRLVSTLPPGQPAPVMAAWYCRLFRRAPGVGFEGRVHEQVAPSIRRAGGTIARSGVVIAHEGYARPSAERIARNLRLLRLELADRPGRAFALLNLGLTLQAAGQWAEAAATLRDALESREAPLDRPLRAVAWTHLAEGHAAAGRWPDAAGAAAAALAEDAGLAVARHVLARARFEAGDIGGAADLFASLREAPADALGMRLHPYLAALGLGVCRLRQERFAEAAATLAAAADGDPSGETAFQLGNALLGQRQLDGAARAYERARARGFAHEDLDRRLALCNRLAGRLTFV